MSSLSPKDRMSLCIFTYADGRRCRLPRASKGSPHAGAPPSSERGPSTFDLCPYHAQKESRAATADKLAKDLSAFFSGHYVSANDLSAAMARLIPAVVRGDIKPRTARAVAYMAQTLLQSIHLAQSEFKDALGPDNYRRAIRSGIASNHDRLFPPKPQPDSVASQPMSGQPTPAPTAPPQVCHPVSEAKDLSPPCVDQPRIPPHSHNPTATRQQTTHTQTRRPATASTDRTASANPKRRPDSPHRDPYAIHFDHAHRLIEPEKAY